MKGPVRPSLATVLAAAVLASAIVLGGRAAADDTEPEITSWMLPPSTRPVWGLLDVDRVRGSGPPLETMDSLTGNWRGYRDWLSNEYGLSLVGNYTSECAGNPIGGTDNAVVKLDSNGNVLWSQPVNNTPEAYFHQMPIIDGNQHILFNSSDGYVYAFDTSGNQLWKVAASGVALGGMSFGSMAIGKDGTLYVPGNDGTLYALK